ncbi:GA45A-like protein [Mya arenaria]|uniref:GA45A-like protein n=1 Tax=Mya arenaria TaxID=6604 RepID=A0ABY7FT13_MYAAR|nr:growth arrest and DNA damage-inducible protein GADD45 gamma-like [Mya arenaria]WAR24004.1 GA45A-like protein [Mya arenaria]
MFIIGKNEIVHTLKMTLHDIEDKIALDIDKLGPGDIWPALRQAMMRAYTDARLTCGVVDCAKQLQTEPDHVFLCILPETADRITSVRIQHKLMEAYCRENGIPVIKLEIKTAISEMLKQVKVAAKNNHTHPRLERKTSNPRDFNCFLVTDPDVMSSDELRVQKFCDAIEKEAEIIVEIPS